MPSASLSSNMNSLVRETYQSNGLIRSHQQPTASSQTSLQKLPAPSPQFLYATNSQQQAPQQHMQFPPPPPLVQMGPLVSQQTHAPKNESNMSSFNPMIVPQSQQVHPQQQQQAINLNHTSLMPQSNCLQPNSLSQPQILMSPMVSTKNPHNQSIQHQKQQQHLMQQQQQHHHQQQHQQQIHQQYQQQQQQQQQQQHLMQQQQPLQSLTPNQPLSQSVAQQQVPMTTIMIPASAAAHLQSASIQIQQAAMQATANNPGQPQILVFMIPYMISQPPTVPPTPDQTGMSSTLVRQSQSSIIRPQPPAPLHSRTLSSLSNAKPEPESFYIKANFNFQTTRHSRELSFRKGDILHVLDTLQNNDHGRRYWLATRVKSNGKDAEKGFIPDRCRAEEIALEQRTLDIGEPGGSIDGGTGGVLGASVGRVSFLKRKAAQRSKSLCKDNWDNVVFDIGSFKLPVYERVVYKHPGFCRPVVIFGPLADVAREKLLKDYPEKYSYPTGFNQSIDHPRVIRLQGILEVIDQGKHALLDITPSAVEKLNYVNMAPIVIFMKTESKSIIKEFRARAAKSLDPNIRDEGTLRRDGKSSRKLLEQSMKLEKLWSHVFTATLDLTTMGSEMWYRKLRETIENQQSANVWMSERKSDRKQLANLTSATASANANPNEVLFPMPIAQSSASCLDSSSVLNERFSESLTITSKSTIDLAPEGPYGNRSQLRNAYAHSLAQKLARASSEPKLNGMMSDHEDDDDDDNDDEIIKKPFPAEFENSSSVSSSNGATSYGHSSMTGSNMAYQHYPPQAAKSEQVLDRAPESIYARNPLVNNAYGNNQSSSSNYHPLPPMTSDNGYHHNQSMTNINTTNSVNNNNGTHNTANTNNNNVIDLSRNHDTRGSAFQVYSDLNQNNYHYYNLNKI